MRAPLLLLQNWVTYSAGYNTTLAMIVDNQVNGPYSLAIHNGQSLPVLVHALSCEKDRVDRHHALVSGLALAVPPSHNAAASEATNISRLCILDVLQATSAMLRASLTAGIRSG